MFGVSDPTSTVKFELVALAWAETAVAPIAVGTSRTVSARRPLAGRVNNLIPIELLLSRTERGWHPAARPRRSAAGP